MFDLFIAEAFAQAATAPAPQPNILMDLIPVILIVAVFYFLLIRPQQKKLQEHQRLVLSLEKGATVVTAGGVIGTINKVDNDENVFHIEIADGVVVKIKRDTVTEVVSKEATAKAKPKNKETASKTKSTKTSKK